MSITNTTTTELIINTLTRAQYATITPSATELYMVTDDDFYSAGNNISITNGTISATYSAGQNVTINNGTISATNTTYSAGDGISIFGGTISTDTTIPTKTELSTILTDYVTTANLSTTLANYPTTADITTTLADYVTTANLSTTLANYPTTADITTTLADYVTTAGLSSTLADYTVATFTDISAATSATVSNLKINKITSAEYATITPSDTELYFITDESPITIDTSLSTTSTHPVQNRVITNALGSITLTATYTSATETLTLSIG